MINNSKDWPILIYKIGVEKFLGISKTKYYEIVKLPDFPKARNIDGKTSMYLTKEIEEWANNLDKVHIYE